MCVDNYVLLFLLQMSKKLGSKTPMVISTAWGIVGRDALTDKFKEVLLCLPFLAFSSSKFVLLWQIVKPRTWSFSFKQVSWWDFRSDFSDEDDSITRKDENYGIVLTIGYVPGLKVDVVPLLRSTKVKNTNSLRDFTDWRRKFEIVATWGCLCSIYFLRNV